MEELERQEENPHYQDDYRIAWLTVRFAARGDAAPHVSATYAVLGVHPEKVWASIVARRKAQLGPLYEKVFGVDLPPKKPAGSVRRALGEREAG